MLIFFLYVSIILRHISGVGGGEESNVEYEESSPYHPEKLLKVSKKHLNISPSKVRALNMCSA